MNKLGNFDPTFQNNTFNKIQIGTLNKNFENKTASIFFPQPIHPQDQNYNHRIKVFKSSLNSHLNAKTHCKAHSILYPQPGHPLLKNHYEFITSISQATNPSQLYIPYVISIPNFYKIPINHSDLGFSIMPISSWSAIYAYGIGEGKAKAYFTEGEVLSFEYSQRNIHGEAKLISERYIISFSYNNGLVHGKVICKFCNGEILYYDYDNGKLVEEILYTNKNNENFFLDFSKVQFDHSITSGMENGTNAIYQIKIKKI